MSAPPTLIRRSAEAADVTSATSLAISPRSSTYATPSGNRRSGARTRSAWPDEVERLAGCADKSGVARCTKNYYADQASARKALRFAREKAKPGMKVPHRVYPCDVCDGWHLTSKASGRKLPPWDRDPSWSRPSADGLERRGRAGSSKGSRHHAQP